MKKKIVEINSVANKLTSRTNPVRIKKVEIRKEKGSFIITGFSQKPFAGKFSALRLELDGEGIKAFFDIFNHGAESLNVEKGEQNENK